MKKIRSFTFSIILLTLLHSNIHAQMPVDIAPIEDENQSTPYKPSINLFTLDTSEEALYSFLFQMYTP